MSATLPKPPSLIASRTQTMSSVSFDEAPATPPTRGEPNKAFATPAHRKAPDTPLGPTPPKPICRGPPESAEERAAELVVLAARQPTTKLPSGSLVRRGTRKARLDVDANDMNQEAARRSWDAAEALCAVADAASPES